MSIIKKAIPTDAEILKSTCIYKKNNILDLADLERGALMKDSWRICHHSKDACCRGYWNKHKNNFNLGRIAQRLSAVRFVNVNTLGGDNA